MAGFSLALLAVLCFSPSLLGDRVSSAIDGLGAADPGLLWAAGIAFAGTSICGALAWRAALRASGSPLPLVDASARYAVGCGVNAIAPAHVGSALRVALFGRVTERWLLDRQRRRGSGRRHPGRLARRADRTRKRRRRAAALAAPRHRRDRRRGRCSRSGLAPRLAPGSRRTASCGLQVACRLAARSGDRRRAGRSPEPPRRSQRRPRSSASMGIDNPLRAALVLVPAVELAAVLPITPGNVGLASAAVALALGSQGVDSRTASVGRNRVRSRRAPHRHGRRRCRRACTRRPVGSPVPPRCRRWHRGEPGRDRVRRDRAAARRLDTGSQERSERVALEHARRACARRENEPGW